MTGVHLKAILTNCMRGVDVNRVGVQGTLVWFSRVCFV